jgi:hypothetical protein
MQSVAAPLPVESRKTRKWPWFLGAVLLVLGLLGLGAYKVYQRAMAHREMATAFVQEFHHRMNQGETGKIIAESAPAFRESTKPEELEALFAGVRRKMGEHKHARQTFMQWNAQTGIGTTLSVRFDSEFANGKAQENFTLLLQDGGVKLYGYRINSPLLVTQ